MSCIIGIDPSIQGTGICIKGDKVSYAYIVPKATKKMLQWPVHIVLYDNEKPQDDPTKELYKSKRVFEITRIIEDIIDEYKPSLVVIEAIAYAANGSIDMLAGLNYAIRNLCLERDIPIKIVSPTTLKKISVGSGKASKELMVETWNLLENLDIDCDDLADAYFLASLENPQTA